MTRLGLVAVATVLAIGGVAQAQTVIAVPEAPGVHLSLVPAPDGADLDAGLPRVIQSFGAKQGGIDDHAAPTQVDVGGTALRVERVRFTRMPEAVFLFMTARGRSGICVAAIPMAQIAQAAAPVGTACVRALGGAPGPADAPAARRPAEAPAAPAAHPGNWTKVDGVYFRSLPGIGVGGGVTVRFVPMVLFTDGNYYQTIGVPLEDIDLAADRAANPDRWGRWSRQGGGFVLTNAKGKASTYQLQKGNFFKAYPASGTASLTGAYKTLGGGGNTSLGGDVMIASANRYHFQSGGTFSTERSTGASSGGGGTGVSTAYAGRQGGGGRFSVDRHTITIEQADGRSERKFFAFGSQGSPPRIDKELLFIGRSTYTPDRSAR